MHGSSRASRRRVSGETVEVDGRSDGRWAVAVQRNGGALWFVVCKRRDGGWIVEDDGEMSASEGLPRGSWLSLLDDDEDGPNVGVEITWGTAPTEVVRGVLTIGSEQFDVRVDDGRYWLVRWEVPDPAENNDWDADVVGFAAA